MTSPVEAARVRVENATRQLKAIFARDLTLDDLASAVTLADELLSAVTFLYDGCYEACRSRRTIGRLKTERPISRDLKRCEAPDCGQYIDLSDSPRPGARRFHKACEERMRKRRQRAKTKETDQ